AARWLTARGSESRARWPSSCTAPDRQRGEPSVSIRVPVPISRARSLAGQSPRRAQMARHLRRETIVSGAGAIVAARAGDRVAVERSPIGLEHVEQTDDRDRALLEREERGRHLAIEAAVSEVAGDPALLLGQRLAYGGHRLDEVRLEHIVVACNRVHLSHVL